MNNNYYCVIMAGGVGERFWPMSTMERPKQFIDILEVGETLIQQTFKRLAHLCPPENILVVTNKIYRHLVKEQLPLILEENILCEPARRNTAPCLAYACHKIAKKNPNGIMLVAPSDHVILEEQNFLNTVENAMKAASEEDWLLTLGIDPSRPETGFGYIKFREGNPYPKDERIYKVSTFTEKPTLEIAQQFLESGNYLWNAGIFIWSLPAILHALKTYLPEVDSLFAQGASAYYTPDEEAFIQQTYSVCRSISIDYGIMEKADNVYVLKSEFGWSDLGTWGSLYAFLPKNKNHNALYGNNTLEYETENCLVNVQGDKLVVLQGLDGFVVVEKDDVLLICKKDEEKRFREIINDVRLAKGDRYL